MNKTRERHGMGGTKFYWVWHSMLARCNPRYTKLSSFSSYAGRGIKVCERWKKFTNFAEDMYESYIDHTYDHDNTTLERINNDGDYCPENCHWVTQKEQKRNTTRTRFITFEGKTLSLDEWADKTGIERGTLAARIYKLKWPVQKAFTIKPK